MEKNLRGFKLGIYTNALKTLNIFLLLLFSIFSIISIINLNGRNEF